MIIRERNERPVKEARNAKFKTINVLQGNYGYGWEDLCHYDDTPEGWKEQKADIKAYRENERGVPFRIITRKEPNPDYKAPEDRFRVYPITVYSGRPNKVGETKKFTDMEDAIEYANSLGVLCTLKDMVTGNNVQVNSSDKSFSGRNIDVFRNAVSKSISESLKEEMYHHIDNGYSMVKPNYRSILINDFWIDFVGTIDEMTDSFYFEEDEQGGFGNVQFYGECKLSGDINTKFSGDFIKFEWWFNVNLVGDATDETKIYLEIDNSLIESDLFEYELDNTNMIEDKASDFLYNNAYDIGEFIWNVIKNNATSFGYAK